MVLSCSKMIFVNENFRIFVVDFSNFRLYPYPTVLGWENRCSSMGLWETVDACENHRYSHPEPHNLFQDLPQTTLHPITSLCQKQCPSHRISRRFRGRNTRELPNQQPSHGLFSTPSTTDTSSKYSKKTRGLLMDPTNLPSSPK